MDMTGERRIPAPREKVWAALNDPDVLKASIPGCETLEKLSDHEMKATASVKIGPIAARFTGKVNLLDLDPPSSYRIEGEGAGGVAGFAKGGAAVRLADDGADTLLSYDVKAQVGGKIAQLGARLIDATAKQMADAFFNRFAAQVTADTAAPAATSAATPVATAAGVSPTLNAPAPAGSAPVGPAPIAPASPAPISAGAAPSIPTPLWTPVADAPVAAPAARTSTIVRPVPAAEPLNISLFSLVPRAPFGFPIVAWIGGVIFLAIFIMIFGSYL